MGSRRRPVLEVFQRRPSSHVRTGRASTISLVALANLVGTAAGMVLAPVWVEAQGPDGIASFQWVPAAASAVATVAFLLVHRGSPARRRERSAERGVRALELTGLQDDDGRFGLSLGLAAALLALVAAVFVRQREARAVRG